MFGTWMDKVQLEKAKLKLVLLFSLLIYYCLRHNKVFMAVFVDKGI